MWILDTGYWNDNGEWVDTEFWYDLEAPPIEPEPELPWLMKTGFWDDNGQWIDSAVWEDKPGQIVIPPEEILIDPSKKNIQLFRTNDEFSYAMYDVVDAVNKYQQEQYWLLKDTFETSKDFGEFLWDNKLFDLAEFFSRRYWSDNYEAIIHAMEIAGTYEAIITVVESAMGSGIVTFQNPEPSHLIVNIAPDTVNQPWFGVNTDQSREQMIGYDESEASNFDYYFADNRSPLSFQETVKLIELLNVNGVFLEITTI